MENSGGEAIEREIRELVDRSGFLLSEDEWEGRILNDFGLGDFRREGAAIIDILRSPFVRTTILVMLPNQVLPEHRHPATEAHPGKEETIRVLWGTIKTYQPGEPAENVEIVPGKEACYTSRRETSLTQGEQHTLPPDEPHWFRAGPEGVVAIEFQNRVDETRNVFTDPESAGIAIGASD